MDTSKNQQRPATSSIGAKELIRRVEQLLNPLEVTLPNLDSAILVLEGEAPPPLSERFTAYCNRPETLQLLRDCRREWFTLEIRTSAKQALVSALAGDASI